MKYCLFLLCSLIFCTLASATEAKDCPVVNSNTENTVSSIMDNIKPYKEIGTCEIQQIARYHGLKSSWIRVLDADTFEKCVETSTQALVMFTTWDNDMPISVRANTVKYKFSSKTYLFTGEITK